MTDYFIGWDVGGWNCDRNPKSRDALCVVTSEGEGVRLLGTAWRGNVREDLVRHEGAALIEALLARCELRAEEPYRVVLGIDTPLAWSEAAVALLARGETTTVPSHAVRNPYLFRRTERMLAERGCPPLSAVRRRVRNAYKRSRVFHNVSNT